MRNTFDVNFYARESKANKKGLAHIEMTLSVNGDRHFYNTPMMVRPQDFNRKRQPKEIVDYCSLMRSRVNTILTDMLSAGEPITSERILSYLRQGGYKSKTVKDVFDEYLSMTRQRVGLNLTYNAFHKYEAAAGLFYEVISPDREFNSITTADITKFKIHLSKRYVKSSLSATLTKVKTMYSYGCGAGYNKGGADAFNGIRIERQIKPVETITDTEMKRISNTSFVSPYRQRIADLFVFACGSGLAFCDCMELEPSDFVDYEGHLCVFKERRKTGVKFYSVLLPEAKRIAEKYNYDFSSLKISNQKTNQALKDIQSICDITSVPSLHFHQARHYYAMHLLNSGVPVTTLQKCLGHKSITMSLHYAHAQESTIVKEVAASFA